MGVALYLGDTMTWIKKEWTALYSTHKKWGIAVVGFGATLLNEGLVHGTAAHDIQVGIALATALGVRKVRNTGTTQGASTPAG